MRRRRCLGVTFAVLMLVAPACTSSEGADGTPTPTAIAESVIDEATAVPLPTPTATIPDSGSGPIIVAALLAQSGVMVTRDLPALVGVRYEVGQLNSRGGVMGRTVDLVEVDTESRVGVTHDATVELIKQGVDLLVVSCDAQRAAPALELAAVAGVLAISPCAVGEEWNDLGPLVFSMGISARTEGLVMAEWAMEHGLGSTVALRDETNPDVEAFCDAFLNRYVELGGIVAWVDSFTFDSLGPFEDRLAQRPLGMASVLLCSHLPGGLNGAPNIIELVRSRGIEVPILAGSGVDGGPTWFNAVANLGVLTMVSPTSTHGDDPNPLVKDLLQTVTRDQPVSQARGWTVSGAETIQAWAIASERAQSVDGGRVAEQLEAFTNERLLDSQVTFGPGDHMDGDRPLRVIQLANGEATTLEVRSAGQ